MTRNPGTPSPRNRSVTASIPHYLFYLNNSSGREGGVDRGCSQQEKAARRIRPARPADLQNNLQGGACTNMKILQSDRIRVYLGTSAFKPIALTGLTRIVPPRFRISMAHSVHRTGSPSSSVLSGAPRCHSGDEIRLENPRQARDRERAREVGQGEGEGGRRD